MTVCDDGIGATGEFPHGKVDEDDEGALQIAIAVDEKANIVRILFGTRISWLGLEKAEAFGLAQALIKKARQLKKD